MPGFIDLQVNGYAGADFNGDGLSAETLCAACERLATEGVERILATVITDDLDRMCQRLTAIVAVRATEPVIERIIAGIHIEGPFLNGATGYIGAHPQRAVRPADMNSMKRLLEAAGGLTRIVTLAPECDPGLRVTEMLAKAEVVVAAGHTNASHEELHAAIDAGLTMFTHLGNGCPLELPRHDNIIQRALSFSDRLWIGLIADGAHLPVFVLKNFLKTIGFDRAFVVSDAITAAGLGPGEFKLGDRAIRIGEDLVARTEEGYLAGSACPMNRAAKNLKEALGLTDLQIEQLTRDNPLRAVPKL